MSELNEDGGFVDLKGEVRKPFIEFPKLVSAHITESDYQGLLDYAKAHNFARGSQKNVGAVVRLAIEEFVSKIKAAELVK